MQDWNEFHMYVDSDNNDSTGYYVNGIGAEIEWNFGSRSGFAFLEDNQIEIYQNDISLRLQLHHHSLKSQYAEIHFL